MATSFPASPRLLVVVECAGGELGDSDKGILSAAHRISGLLGGTWEAAVVPGESVTAGEVTWLKVNSSGRTGYVDAELLVEE